jgi:hypothetical protein
MKLEASMSKVPKVSKVPKGEFTKVFREKVEQEVVPRLTDDPQVSQRSAVAVRIIAIVERQIGLGDPEAAQEWATLRDVVKENPAAVKLVEDLGAALTKYSEDLSRQIGAGADEAKIRKTAVGLIKMAIMAKLRLLWATGPAPPKRTAGELAEAAPAEAASDEATTDEASPEPPAAVVIDPKAGN